MATNRRDAVKRGLALLGAVVGIGAASRAVTFTQDGSPEMKQGQQLVLHGRCLRISSQDFRRGELPQSGIRMLAKAEIVADASHGRKVGDFFASYYRINTAGKVAHDEPGSLEHHTFILPEGNIFGSGVATSGTDSDGQFAIIGGTGRYVGARGSYTARQSHVDFGGDGTATFSLTLI